MLKGSRKSGPRAPSVAMLRCAFGPAASVALASCMVGCAAMPYGIVTNHHGQHVAPDDHDVLIIAVDGKMNSTELRRQRVGPGPHLLQLASTRPGFHDQLTYQPVALRVEACMEYAFVARHEGRLSNRSWQPVLVSETRIQGCTETP